MVPRVHPIQRRLRVVENAVVENAEDALGDTGYPNISWYNTWVSQYIMGNILVSYLASSISSGLYQFYRKNVLHYC